MASAESQAVALIFRDDRPGGEGECLHRLAEAFDLAVFVLVGQFDAGLDGCGDRVAVTGDELGGDNWAGTVPIGGLPNLKKIFRLALDWL